MGAIGVHMNVFLNMGHDLVYMSTCANIFVIVGYFETPKSHIDRVNVCNCSHEIVITVIIRFSCKEM